MRIRYRLWQFWQALTAYPKADELVIVENILSPSLLQLFKIIPVRDQTHAIRVCKRLVDQGETNPSLLMAGLLHDIGKSRYPIRLWEKVWIVLGKKWFIANELQAKSFETDDPKEFSMWIRPFWVAARHAEWGAKILEMYHVDSLTIWLVHNHHQYLSPLDCDDLRKELLDKLIQADQMS